MLSIPSQPSGTEFVLLFWLVGELACDVYSIV
jgi:hypothetical protein